MSYRLIYIPVIILKTCWIDGCLLSLQGTNKRIGMGNCYDMQCAF